MRAWHFDKFRILNTIFSLTFAVREMVYGSLGICIQDVQNGSAKSMQIFWHSSLLAIFLNCEFPSHADRSQSCKIIFFQNCVFGKRSKAKCSRRVFSSFFLISSEISKLNPMIVMSPASGCK